MKYIRTTSDIYQSNYSRITKVTSIEKNGEEHPCLEINLGYSTSGFITTRNERIIKESDNIEELCDEFVVYDNYKKKWLHFIDLKSLVAYCDENGLDKTFIKGAIWTDKGLVYVAKMNKNGELELL